MKSKPRKPGRPKSPAGKVRAPGVSVRLTESEMDEVKSAVKKTDLSQSEWVRKSLLTVARGGIRIT